MLKIITNEHSQWNNLIITYQQICLRLINGLINFVGFESVIQIVLYNILYCRIIKMFPRELKRERLQPKTDLIILQTVYHDTRTQSIITETNRLKGNNIFF